MGESQSARVLAALQEADGLPLTLQEIADRTQVPYKSVSALVSAQRGKVRSGERPDSPWRHVRGDAAGGGYFYEANGAAPSAPEEPATGDNDTKTTTSGPRRKTRKAANGGRTRLDRILEAQKEVDAAPAPANGSAWAEVARIPVEGYDDAVPVLRAPDGSTVLAVPFKVVLSLGEGGTVHLNQ